MNEFSIAWNKKFTSQTRIADKEVTVGDALLFTATLSNDKGEKMNNAFELKWKSIGLQNFNLQRPILRYELAAILDQYNVFNIFDVDIYGNYTKL